MLVATTNDLAGHKIVRNLGVVRGIVVRSRCDRRQYRRLDPVAVRRQYHALHIAVRAGAGRCL